MEVSVCAPVPSTVGKRSAKGDLLTTPGHPTQATRMHLAHTSTILLYRYARC